MKKIPYGISSFKILIEEDYLYMDKTNFIQTIEEDSRYLVMLRPRRFGKSLLLSTLQHYYDEQESENFDALFGNFIIGKNPTSKKNSYKILFFEFSRIETENRETIYQGFLQNVGDTLEKFLIKYGYRQSDIEKLKLKNTPEGLMKTFFIITRDEKIYLLIDEYDHFANSILAEDMELFRKIVGKGGFVRSFYETIKAETQTGVVDRLFITGVTPITMDSMTSGFNIARDVTNNERYNHALGFTRQETLSILQQIFDRCNREKEELLELVTQWYNGYKFNTKAEETIFNPNMLLYFMNEFDFNDCTNPQNMLDANIASDYGKIMRLFKLGDREENFKVLESLIKDNEIIAKLI
ncbi:AAA family ATPase, partial [bacterium]|nr:AAA family ATPase [bacterium]MBU1956883.1 AAA family ATPase [bacterium]